MEQRLEPGGEENLPQRRATDGLDWRLPAPVVGQPAVPAAGPEPAEIPAPAPAPPPAPVRESPRGLAGYVAAGLLGGLLGGAVAGLIVWMAAGGSDSAAKPGTGAARTPGAITQVEISSAITDAAAKVRPSVVRIESTKRTPGGVEHDVGSGVVLDTQGHIATNAHVVMGTSALKVILADGTERNAILLGHDYPFTDVAVLQVSPGGLTPIVMADSGALRQGETVIAVGEALAEFEWSMTAGIVSGLNRKRYYDGVVQPDFIQTDAAINHGNSGGALANIKGELVGMPTSIIRETESGDPVEGVAFALPSNRVADIAGRIIAAGGPIARASLGFEHIDLVPDNLARLPKLAVDEGAIVSAIPAGSGAADAGIKVGDIVTMLGDQAITRQNPLLNALMRFEPGQAVKVVLNRGGRIIETEVRLVKRS